MVSKDKRDEAFKHNKPYLMDVMDDETKEKIVYNILKEYAKDNGLVEYNYPDGFYCFGNPDSQEIADKKHEEWLKKQNYNDEN